MVSGAGLKSISKDSKFAAMVDGTDKVPPVVDIPAFRTPSGRWYVNLRAKLTSDIDNLQLPQEDRVFRVVIDTRGLWSWVVSYTTLYTNQTNRISYAGTDWPAGTLLDTTKYSLFFDPGDQRHYETSNSDDVPYSISGRAAYYDLSANDTSDQSLIYSKYLVRLVADEYKTLAGTEFDGRFALGGIDGQGRRVEPNFNPGSAVGLQGALRDWGTFATYFNAKPGKPHLLQLNVHPVNGDESKYEPIDKNISNGLIWVPCLEFQEGAFAWALIVPSFWFNDNDYPTVYPQWQPPAPLQKGRLDLPEITIDYIYSKGHILDSANPWTRLNHILVYNIYEKIESSIVFNGTYYVPCNITESEIPPLRIGTAATVEGENGYYLPLSGAGFAVQHYRHPTDPNYCGGTIQNVVDTLPILGQWFFTNYYLVFKSTDPLDPSSGGRPRRQIGMGKPK
ncbi:hypothetical protein TWF506_004498 [Arthrobotrys conoides]|uniref:Peptidase A1 domain-containing protein n=1 Tax=Arthrobotrys conoides TaxID=74498 RepID=A0AAN8NFU5_9PEZI